VEAPSVRIPVIPSTKIEGEVAEGRPDAAVEVGLGGGAVRKCDALASFFSFSFLSFGFFVSRVFTSAVLAPGFESSAKTETGAQARTNAVAHAIFLITFHPSGAACCKREQNSWWFFTWSELLWRL
jgi:hypothetical protein